MMLYLIRHGHTEGTENRLYYGVTDYQLTAAGRAEIAANRDAGIYPPPGGKLFFTSELSRTKDTLRIIYGDVPFSSSAAINEINMGDYEGHSHEELMNTPGYRKWLDHFTYELPYPGGESAGQLRARALPYLEALAAGGDAVVVCHGGVIGAVMQSWFGRIGDDFYQWLPAPSRGFAVKFENGAPAGYTAI